jgi:acyl-homoserine lactone acylase PvdQ
MPSPKAAASSAKPKPNGTGPAKTSSSPPTLSPAAISWIAPYFSVGPIGISGSSQSVKQTGSGIIPSLRFVADTSDWDNSLLILPTGQSGHLVSGFSRRYKDEWPDFATGRARPFKTRQVEAANTLTLIPSN